MMSSLSKILAFFPISPLPPVIAKTIKFMIIHEVKSMIMPMVAFERMVLPLFTRSECPADIINITPPYTNMISAALPTTPNIMRVIFTKVNSISFTPQSVFVPCNPLLQPEGISSLPFRIEAIQDCLF